MSDLETQLRETLHRHAAQAPSDVTASRTVVAAVRRRRTIHSTLFVASAVVAVLAILLSTRLLTPSAAGPVEPTTTDRTTPLVYLGPDQGIMSRGADGNGRPWLAGARLTGLCRALCAPVEMQWSPDGRTLAVLMGPPCCLDRTTVSVVAMSAGGRHARLLFACPKRSGCADGYPRTLAWSPDSHRILLTTNKEMYVVPAGGGSPDLICTCAALDASFLPDGGVAYVTPGRLLAQDLASGETTTLAEIPGLSGATWSPDGRWMLAGADDGSLSLMDMTASPPAPVTPQHVEGFDAQWSPDGARFVYLTQAGHNLKTFRVELWVGAPGERPRLLHRFSKDAPHRPAATPGLVGAAHGTAWSSDGTEIVQWIDDGSWPGTLHIVDADSGKLVGRTGDAMGPIAWAE